MGASLTFEIGPLRGGGLVLGYRCTARCRHCLYGSGPHRRDGELADRARLDALLDELARRAPHARWHIGGGEPFLDIDRLEHVIGGLESRGLTLDYVETNASWARDAAYAEKTLTRLAKSGLGCVLVSLSPFHAEQVPFARTKLLIEAAERTLPGGAFVWIAQFARDLMAHAADERVDLDALFAARGDAYVQSLAARYGLVPGGRAGRLLHRHGARIPWRIAATRAPCAERLGDTSHFHIDLEGRYVPGLCAGIALPLSEVPGRIDLGRYAVLRALVQGGPEALVELARSRGFVPFDTYGSACDLCGHARSHLAADGHAELGPPGFYDPRSVDFGRRPASPG